MIKTPKKIKIDKNVPIPTQGKGTSGKYPYDELKVGESFFIPNEKMSNVCCYTNRAKRNSDKNFTSRTINGGVRIWRIK